MAAIRFAAVHGRCDQLQNGATAAQTAANPLEENRENNRFSGIRGRRDAVCRALVGTSAHRRRGARPFVLSRPDDRRGQRRAPRSPASRRRTPASSPRAASSPSSAFRVPLSPAASSCPRMVPVPVWLCARIRTLRALLRPITGCGTVISCRRRRKAHCWSESAANTGFRND